jgi:hypothetical protein
MTPNRVDEMGTERHKEMRKHLVKKLKRLWVEKKRCRRLPPTLIKWK